MRIVVKFGGTSLKNPARVQLAASNLIKLAQSGKQVIAVVSAPGNMTNKLIQQASKIGKRQTESKSYMEFLALGEQMSTHMLSMALKENGQDAEAIPQISDKFPLISLYPFFEKGEVEAEKTNQLKQLAIDEEATALRMKKHIIPLLERGVIPVIAGFFIKDSNGDLVTLGRGGSDITSFLIGKYLNCDEVVIITDVNGVFTSDPRCVKKARVIDSITADDLALFSRTGAQVIHPNALRFKTDQFKAKIVHFKDLSKLVSLGTTIEGAVNTKISTHDKELTLFTFTGKNLSQKMGVLAKVSTWLSERGIAIHSLSAGDSFLSLYLEGNIENGFFNDMHEKFIEKESLFGGLTRVKNVGEIRISNHIFVESPGVISMISDHLYREGINIIEMLTAHTDIVVYVARNVMEKSVKILQDKFGAAGINGEGLHNARL